MVEGMAERVKSESGFTLVELMVVMLIIGVLAAIAIPSYTGAIHNAREATFKMDLQVMRQAIDSYTMDKEKAPQSLDDLVQAGYLERNPDGSNDAQQLNVGDGHGRLGGKRRPDRGRDR